MLSNKLTILDKIDMSKTVCDHLIGSHHTHMHRITAGSVIMIIGVTIAKSGHAIPFILLEYVVDIVGYLIHGIGAIPIIEKISQSHEPKDKNTRINDSERNSE